MRTSPSRPAAALALALAGGGVASCGGAAAPDPACSSARCGSLTFVSKTMAFTRHADPVGAPDVVPGFDLDGHVTTDEEVGCFQQDQTSPEGVPGIDNAAAHLFELVRTITDDALDGLLQMAINQGDLLVVLRLEGVDDLTNDDEVSLRILKATGVPQLGNDSRITPNQTFQIDPSVPSTAGRGRIVDGMLEAGPFEAVVPFQVFHVGAAMRFHDCRVRGRLTPDGQLVGVMLGGGVELSQIYDIAAAADINAIFDLLPYVLDPSADMGMNEQGVCEQISAAIEVETQPAYLLDDPFRR